MAAGRLVNLERPLRADARLGGHFVLGHVDGVGRIAALRPDGDCYWLEVEVPAALAPLRHSEGLDRDRRHQPDDRVARRAAASASRSCRSRSTHTALREARAGDAVNLEADVLGKYVARLMQSDCAEHRQSAD